MDDQKQFWIMVLLSTFFGGTGASASAVKKNIPMGQAILAVFFACLFSAGAPFCLVALGMHLAWAIPVAIALGVFIFGILALADNTEKKIPDINVGGLLPPCIADALKKQPKDGEAK